MALIEWDEKYSVKVKRFDDQHKRLIDMINRLHEAMRGGKGREIIGQILDELVDYTKIHFSFEEEVMSLHGYPGLATQKQQHESLVRQVEEFREKERQGHLTLSMEVMSFLKDGWLVKHIVGSDKEYGAFFNDKGVG